MKSQTELFLPCSFKLSSLRCDMMCPKTCILFSSCNKSKNLKKKSSAFFLSYLTLLCSNKSSACALTSLRNSLNRWCWWDEDVLEMFLSLFFICGDWHYLFQIYPPLSHISFMALYTVRPLLSYMPQVLLPLTGPHTTLTFTKHWVTSLTSADSLIAKYNTVCTALNSHIMLHQYILG